MSYVDIRDLGKKRSSSEFPPDIFDLYKKIMEQKKNSKILIKSSEIKWIEKGRQVARSAKVIDPENGFTNSIVNIGLGEIPPHGHTGKHKHTEAYIYIVKGKGHSIINEKRYDWETGDFLYIPPDTYHQHFNDGDEPAVYLRVVPGPLIINLMAIFASLNLNVEGMLHQAQTAPEYTGPKPEVYFDELEKQ
ncbi:cupin domain-containing protein [Sulfolobus sp. E11-6]|uniref:cupin domain-containing protein n=1 Tax=Sulfolobus sp. E11-6 TaxID=2663020 RepID=UPI0012970BAC|nr:cupin domain-containing protein [Sulfolobus sp. E11-6]QGA69036.1 cupin domain-containing protein [Sulfolobus sp. E11-6]